MNIVGAAGPLEDGDMFPRDRGREKRMQHCKFLTMWSARRGGRAWDVWYAQDWMFRAANGTVRRRIFSSWGPDACENEGAQPAGRWEPLSPRWWQALRCQPGVSWTASRNDSSWKSHSGPKARRGGHWLLTNDCTLTQIHWRTLEEVFRSFLPLKE